jgi:hypothetical protein
MYSPCNSSFIDFIVSVVLFIAIPPQLIFCYIFLPNQELILEQNIWYDAAENGG